jgi:hypothetical protein
MRDLLLGFLLLAAWAILQFVVQPLTGWIHLLLIGGVLFLIRGIALRGEKTSP